MAKYLTDDQFDELFDHLQGISKTQTEGLEDLGLKGYRLTKEQIIFRKENYKRCSICGRWIGICDYCCR